MNAGPGGYSIVPTGYQSPLLSYLSGSRVGGGWLFLGDPGAKRHPYLCRAKLRHERQPR